MHKPQQLWLAHEFCAAQNTWSYPKRFNKYVMSQEWHRFLHRLRIRPAGFPPGRAIPESGLYTLAQARAFQPRPIWILNSFNMCREKERMSPTKAELIAVSLLPCYLFLSTNIHRLTFELTWNKSSLFLKERSYHMHWQSVHSSGGEFGLLVWCYCYSDNAGWERVAQRGFFQRNLLDGES